MKKMIFPLMIILVFTGCTVGRKMSFSNENIAPDYTQAKSMAVAFQENRKDVVEGREKPSFCGHINSTAHIAYNMQTESGKPLAEDFSGSVVASLVKLGIKAEQMKVNVNAAQDSVIMVFNKGDKERLLLFTINTWEATSLPKFSTIMYEVDYNFDLEVYDRAGALLAKAHTQDHIKKEEPQLAGSLKYLQKMADEVFVSQMKVLLNDAGVKAALQ